MQLPNPPPAVEYPLDGSRIVTVSGKIRYTDDRFTLLLSQDLGVWVALCVCVGKKTT